MWVLGNIYITEVVHSWQRCRVSGPLALGPKRPLIISCFKDKEHKWGQVPYCRHTVPYCNPPLLISSLRSPPLPSPIPFFFPSFLPSSLPPLLFFSSKYLANVSCKAVAYELYLSAGQALSLPSWSLCLTRKRGSFQWPPTTIQS
jgi:hypothetical protein